MTRDELTDRVARAVPAARRGRAVGVGRDRRGRAGGADRERTRPSPASTAATST